MTSKEDYSYIDELVALYLRAASLLKGFRLPIENPFTIEGDNNGRATALVLMLGNEKSICMSDIAERFSISPSSATILVDRMVEKNLVVRKPSEQDRRVVNLELGDEGWKAFEKVREKLDDSLKFLLSPLDEDEKKEFLRIFQKIIDNIPGRNQD